MTEVYHVPEDPSTKICSTCEQEKPLSDYSQRKNGRIETRCKDCVRAADRERNRRRRPRKTPVIPKATRAGYKVCNTCLIEKPCVEFNVDNHLPSGRHGRCKQCEKDQWDDLPEEDKSRVRFLHRQSYARHAESNRERDRKRHSTDEGRAKRRVRSAIKRDARLLQQQNKLPSPNRVAQMSLYKVCPQCETEKFVDSFARDKNRPSGYYPVCKDCQRKWRQSDSGKAWERARGKTRRQNPEYRKRANERKKIWNKNNPMSVRAYVLKRIALKKLSTIESVDLNSILQRDGMHCYICNHDILPEQAFEFDHIIPLSRGGPHSPENIGVSHMVCNRRKHNKLLSELTDFDRRGPD